MDTKKIFLLPGEMVVKKAPTQMVTLLGSCVAVCLYNPQQKFGGMNHFMLPQGRGGIDERYKFGDYATRRLIELMAKGDSNLRNLKAKVYGGGAVVGQIKNANNIGEKNVLMALNVLDKHGIPIEFQDTGGTQGRKIYFKNWTGEVDARKIQKSEFTKDREEREANLSGRKIRVLVVDDSATVRSLLIKGINRNPQMEVAGEAQDAFEARSMLLEKDPDVITLDIVMPKMDGITFLKKIMVYKPKPVIIVSTIAQENSVMRKRAQKIGAAGVIDKEDLKIYQGFDRIQNILCKKILSVATLPVSKRKKEDVISI